jgi:hypothetical protein
MRTASGTSRETTEQHEAGVCKSGRGVFNSHYALVRIGRHDCIDLCFASKRTGFVCGECEYADEIILEKSSADQNNF